MFLKIEGGWRGMILRALLLSLCIFWVSGSFAKERDRHMSIVLVAVGEVDRNMIEALK